MELIPLWISKILFKNGIVVIILYWLYSFVYSNNFDHFFFGVDWELQLTLPVPSCQSRLCYKHNINNNRPGSSIDTEIHTYCYLIKYNIIESGYVILHQPKLLLCHTYSDADKMLYFFLNRPLISISMYNLRRIVGSYVAA